MLSKRIIAEVGLVFKRWFHKRNLIVVSEHKVKHIPISVGAQLCGVTLAMTLVCWAAYSTGSFVAARHALKEQGQTLRLVTNAKIETGFNPLFKTALIGANDSVFEPETMATRVAYLEGKVNQLQSENSLIISRVQEKTTGKISDLETIIKKTGLDGKIKGKIADSEKPAKSKAGKGGPYIPDSIIPSKEAQELLSDLDHLAALNQIVSAMPLGRPIRGASEQSGFGHRYDPFNNQLAFHSGLDLSGPAGSKIFSTADGVVTNAERDGSYGNMIDIDHGNGISTRYGHLSQILVERGQKIRKGDVIGIQGSTGRSTGAHLHYEVRYHDQPMNPKNFLQAGQYVSEN